MNISLAPERESEFLCHSEREGDLVHSQLILWLIGTFEYPFLLSFFLFFFGDLGYHLQFMKLHSYGFLRETRGG